MGLVPVRIPSFPTKEQSFLEFLGFAGVGFRVAGR